MDNEDQNEIACELFEQYAALLNQEFHDHVYTEKVGRECIAIATQLLKLGFVILTDMLYNMEVVALSDDTTRVIFTFIYELILVPNEIPAQDDQQPIAYADAVSKVFGPVTAQVRRDHTHAKISSKDEVWLHSILDDLGTDKNSPTKEGN